MLFFPICCQCYYPLFPSHLEMFLLRAPPFIQISSNSHTVAYPFIILLEFSYFLQISVEYVRVWSCPDPDYMLIFLSGWVIYQPFMKRLKWFALRWSTILMLPLLDSLAVLFSLNPVWVCSPLIIAHLRGYF